MKVDYWDRLDELLERCAMPEDPEVPVPVPEPGPDSPSEPQPADPA